MIPATSDATTIFTTRRAQCCKPSRACNSSKRRIGTVNGQCAAAAAAANVWMEGWGKRGVNAIRLEQLMQEKPQTLALACPFCMVMFEDAAKNAGVDEQLHGRIWRNCCSSRWMGRTENREPENRELRTEN
jgi:hypothetical protein